MTRKLSLTLMKFETVTWRVILGPESGASRAEVLVNGLPVPNCVAYTVIMSRRGVQALTLVLEGEPDDLLTVVCSFGGLIQVDW